MAVDAWESFPPEREIHVENSDPTSIYSDLAIRLDVTPDPWGISVDPTFDDTSLMVTLLDQFGGSRSVRLVLAPDEPVVKLPTAPVNSDRTANPLAALGNWLRR